MAMRRTALLAACLALLTLAGCQAEETPREAQVLRWGFDLDQASPDRVLNGFLTWGWNVFDPLVKLDEELRPVPNIAESWELSDDGLTLTFHLREDGRWSNGDPLTARDYAFGWKYNLSEGAPHPPGVFADIAGAEAFAGCDPKKRDCEPLWDDVGIETLGDYTLVVRFARPQPFFLAYVGGYACLCFAPLHRETVERYGESWYEAGHIVTSGPFTIAEWEPEESLVLVKDEGWRDADQVGLDRIEVSFWREDAAAKSAFDEGELDAFFAWTLESQDVRELPALVSQYVGINPARVPDARQRRAMALALDRENLVERDRRRLRPATSLTVDELPGFDRIAGGFLGTKSRLGQAKRLMSEIADPVEEITLWLNEERRSLADPVSEAWGELGLDVTTRIVEWEQFLQVLEGGKVDAYLLGWVYDFPDAINFLEQWRCGSNPSRFCDREYDRLLDAARLEPDEAARIELYARAEGMLTGPAGAMPAIPLAWESLPLVARESVGGFDFNAMGQIDLTRVRLAAG